MRRTLGRALAAGIALLLACGSDPSGVPGAPDAGGHDASALPDAPGGGPADAGRPDAVPPPDARPIGDANADQLTFDALFRAFRMDLGMPIVPLDGRMRQAASNHCFYCENNPADCGLRESHPDGVGFTGEQFWDRLRAVGFVGVAFLEDMSFYNDPQQAFDAWVASLYHRIPLVSYLSSQYGYANGPGCDVADFARGSLTDAGARSHWPLDGAIDLPTTASLEFPVLLPGPIGYPVSVHAGSPISVTAHSFEVEGSGEPVAYQLVDQAGDPNGYVTDHEAFLVPVAPLAASTTYRVRVGGTQDGAAFAESWTFTTAAD